MGRAGPAGIEHQLARNPCLTREPYAFRLPADRARDRHESGGRGESRAGGRSRPPEQARQNHGEKRQRDSTHWKSTYLHVSFLLDSFTLQNQNSSTVGAWNRTPCGVGIGVGRGLRNGDPPLSISQRSSMALSSCKVLWQCSMNIPPKSRNCMVRVTLPSRRRR